MVDGPRSTSGGNLFTNTFRKTKNQPAFDGDLEITKADVRLLADKARNNQPALIRVTVFDSRQGEPLRDRKGNQYFSVKIQEHGDWKRERDEYKSKGSGGGGGGYTQQDDDGFSV